MWKSKKSRERERERERDLYSKNLSVTYRALSHSPWKALLLAILIALAVVSAMTAFAEVRGFLASRRFVRQLRIETRREVMEMAVSFVVENPVAMRLSKLGATTLTMYRSDGDTGPESEEADTFYDFDVPADVDRFYGEAERVRLRATKNPDVPRRWCLEADDEEFGLSVRKCFDYQPPSLPFTER